MNTMNSEENLVYDTMSTQIPDYYVQDSMFSKNKNDIKALYDELADKEQALVLAAQFGKNLIEEKEELERQMDSNKQNHMIQIEKLEQESYELRRQIESMRNEYEAKIYELTEDMNILNKKLIENDQNKNSQQHDQNEKNFLIQDLIEKNQNLINELKTNELKYSIQHENHEKLESKLQEKEMIQNENSKLLSSFQKEITILLKKQQELEYALLQTCNERDKQTKLIEELSKKYIFVENEKNDIEHLIFQHENEIFNLRRVNQDLIYKFENIELHSNALNRKRRSTMNDTNNTPNFNDNISSNTNTSQLNSIKSHLNSLNRNENRFYESNFSDQQYSSPFRQIESSSFQSHRSHLENDLDLFKVNEIEEDEDCDNNEIEDGDESVDIYSKTAYLDNESDHFIGAINWQQEAIEQKIHDENKSNNSQESHDDDSLSNDGHHGRFQNDHSNFVHHQEDSQSNYRSMEEDSNNSILN